MFKFILETNTSVPLYRQLMDQVRRGIASGQLRPGETLPSVRDVARELAVISSPKNSLPFMILSIMISRL